jgi:hypothetical protein
MALAFVPSDAAILCVQAGCVLAPRRPPGVEKLDRFHGPGWALVPIASIVGVIYAIRYVSDTTSWLTDLALVAIPLLAVVALGWAMRGPAAYKPRVAMALAVVPLFLLVWRSPNTLLGQGCGVLLSALSCVTLGVLLAAVAPSGWLKLGIIAMAGADVWLVFSNTLQAPNTQLVVASPGGGLPRLQSESFGSVNMGYGDLFVAAVLGALFSEHRRRQAAVALLTLVLAGAFDLLFFVTSELPATVPVALALIAIEAWQLIERRRSKARDQTAQCFGSPVEAAGGRDSSASEVIASVPRAASSSTSVASSEERA